MITVAADASVPAWIYEGLFPEADEDQLDQLATKWAEQGTALTGRADAVQRTFRALGSTFTGPAAEAAGDKADQVRQFLQSTAAGCTELGTCCTEAAKLVRFAKTSINVVLIALKAQSVTLSLTAVGVTATLSVTLQLKQLQIVAHLTILAISAAAVAKMNALSPKVDIQPVLGIDPNTGSKYAPGTRGSLYTSKLNEVAKDLHIPLTGGGQGGQPLPGEQPGNLTATPLPGQQPVPGANGTPPAPGAENGVGANAVDPTQLFNPEAMTGANNPQGEETTQSELDGINDATGGAATQFGQDYESGASQADVGLGGLVNAALGGSSLTAGAEVAPDGGPWDADATLTMGGQQVSGPGAGNSDGTTVDVDFKIDPSPQDGGGGGGQPGQANVNASLQFNPGSGSSGGGGGGGVPGGGGTGTSATVDFSPGPGDDGAGQYGGGGGHQSGGGGYQGGGGQHSGSAGSSSGSYGGSTGSGGSGSAAPPPIDTGTSSAGLSGGYSSDTGTGGLVGGGPIGGAPAGSSGPGVTSGPPGGGVSLGGNTLGGGLGGNTVGGGFGGGGAPGGGVTGVPVGGAPVGGVPVGGAPVGGAPVGGGAIGGGGVPGGAAVPGGAGVPGGGVPGGGNTAPGGGVVPQPNQQLQQPNANAQSVPGAVAPKQITPPTIDRPREAEIAGRPDGSAATAGPMVAAPFVGAGLAPLFGDLRRSAPLPRDVGSGGLVLPTQFGPTDVPLALLPAGLGIAYQRVLLPGEADALVTGQVTTVRGLVHPLSQIGHLRTPAALHAALGLGFSVTADNGSPQLAFDPASPTIEVLRFAGVRDVDLIVPIAADVTLQTGSSIPPKVRQLGRPWTGGGVAPGSNEDTLIEEFEILAAVGQEVPHLAEIWRFDADGNAEHVATHNARTGLWSNSTIAAGQVGSAAPNGHFAVLGDGTRFPVVPLNDREVVLVDRSGTVREGFTVGDDGVGRRVVPIGEVTRYLGVVTVGQWRGVTVKVLQRAAGQSLVDYIDDSPVTAAELGFRQLGQGQWQQRWVLDSELESVGSWEREYPRFAEPTSIRPVAPAPVGAQDPAAPTSTPDVVPDGIGIRA